MRIETAATAFANMSAPPRSTVSLPRLTVEQALQGHQTAEIRASPTPRDIPVGPGGGRLLSNALCVTRVELVSTLCTHLRMSRASPILSAPLGLARALVAIARQTSGNSLTDGPESAMRIELDRVAALSESALVHELAAWLTATALPTWVPRVAFVKQPDGDATNDDGVAGTPAASGGIRRPLLAARLIAAMRGPVFMRDAAPSLTYLLNLWDGNVPMGTWEIWLPIEPGRVRPAPCANASPQRNPS